MPTATIPNTKAGTLAPFYSHRGAKRVLVWSIETRKCLTPGPCPAPPTAARPPCLLQGVLGPGLWSQVPLCPGEGLADIWAGASERSECHSAARWAGLSPTILTRT